MNKLLKNFKVTAFLLLLGSFVVACQDDEALVPNTVGTGIDSTNTETEFAEINKWIQESMKEVYYWTDKLPTGIGLNQEPKEYFDKLLYSGDRFSVIVPDYDELINSLNGVNMEAGYEYMLTRVSGSETDVVAVILYVKHQSPAALAGLKRGDVITTINGNPMTMSNYRSLIGKISSNHSLVYKRFDTKLGDYEVQPELSLNVVELSENPHFMDTVYTINGKKIGYYVYNFFSPGSNNKEYDNQMDQVIADFKSQGVTDLVLDLRYNSGGAVSSAKNLGSLLGRGVTTSEIFYENRWNPAYQEYWESRPNGDDILRGKFQTKAANIGNNLSGKLYVLVGTRTASASELIINGLKPYMDLYLIGEKTVGKNVGSIPIDDSDNPENSYGILPIAFQVFNSDGSSDYSNGFIPDAEIDEFEGLPMRQLGDVEEPLLATAIADITGTNARIKKNETSRISVVESLGSSIDLKPRTNRLIYDLPVNME